MLRAGASWCDLVKHVGGRVEFVYMQGLTLVCEHADTGVRQWRREGMAQALLYLRAAADGGGRVCAIGQGHNDGSAWATIDGGELFNLGVTACPFPVLIFGDSLGWVVYIQRTTGDQELGLPATFDVVRVHSGGGRVTLATRVMAPTSQGFLYVASNGQPITQDLGRGAIPGLALPSPAPSDVTVWVGQSMDAPTLALFDSEAGTVTSLNTPGGQPPHIVESGGTFYVCSWVDGGAWLSTHRRPFAVTEDEPVLDTTNTVDVMDYLPMGLVLDGDHLIAYRYTGQQPNVFSIAKHVDGGGEWWAHDDQWVYHHLDQAGSPIEEVIANRFTVRRDAQGNRIDAYYLAPDARSMPRRVKTGDDLIVESRIYRMADGSSEPWRHRNSFEVFSSFPTPMGVGPALRLKYDPRTSTDPDTGRKRGRFEKFVYVVVNGRKYHRWEDWRTKDDNSGDEQMQQTQFRQVDTAPVVSWRLSLRPRDASLLPDEDEMNAPGVTVDKYGPVITPNGSWSVEFHDRNNDGLSGKVEIVNGSVHVTLTNPEGSDRSGNRRPVEVKGS
jgi:hypothetical protein